MKKQKAEGENDDNKSNFVKTNLTRNFRIVQVFPLFFACFLFRKIRR